MLIEEMAYFWYNQMIDQQNRNEPKAHSAETNIHK